MNDRRVRDYAWARVWLIFWWVVVDVLAAAYMSNLMSVLTVPFLLPKIQTLKDVADSDIIPCMVDYGSFVPGALRSSTNPVYSTLGHRMYLDPVIYLPDPYHFLLQKVLKGTHGLVVSIDYLIFTQNWKGLTESTYIMDEKLFRGHQTWFLPRNTPYTTVISDRLQRILETGIVANMYNQHTSRITVRRTTRVRGSGVLSLNHLQGAFIALVLGLGAGALVLLGEIVLHTPHKGTNSSPSPSQHLNNA